MEDAYDCFDKRVIIEFEYATQTNSALLRLYIYIYIYIYHCSSSSSSRKFIFQQRTFKNHKIQKYKLHDTCIYHLLWNSLGVNYPVKNGGMSLLKRRVGCWRHSATEDLPVNPALCSNKATLTNLPLAKMAAISQTTFFTNIFLNENSWIALKSSLTFVPKVRTKLIPALVQIKVWHRPGNHYLNRWWLV